MIKALFVLMHCVPIQGLSGTFIFLAGAVECYTPWQKALFPVLAFTLGTPALLWYMTSWLHQQRGDAQSTFARAVLDVLASPYLPEQV
mgnify:CR=1 FL=1